jgi:hypothetical protein
MIGVDKFLLDSRIVIVEYHLESQCILLFDQNLTQIQVELLGQQTGIFYCGKNFAIL